MITTLSMLWPSTSPTTRPVCRPGRGMTSYQSPPIPEGADADRYRAVITTSGSSGSERGAAFSAAPP